MFRLSHGQPSDLEGQYRRKARLAHRKSIALYVRVEFALDQCGQLPVDDQQACGGKQNEDNHRQRYPFEERRHADLAIVSVEPSLSLPEIPIHKGTDSMTRAL
jgi:hypothetical protein